MEHVVIRAARAANATAQSCAVMMKTTSNGAWQGDNPMNFALPLLIVQICIVLLVTGALAFLLSPLRQPRVIAEIIGGILLGPSALGRNQSYMHTLFPTSGTPEFETVANIGLLFFLFLVGLELDVQAIKRAGRKPLAIAAAGITLPFVGGVGVAYVLRATISKGVAYRQFLVFMGVSMSITSIPVLARILAKLKLLTTDLGQMSMAAAAVNDVVAWVLLALAIALSGTHKSPVISVYVLLCGIGFVVFMFLVIKPIMTRIGHRSADNEPVSETYVLITLAGVLAAGFATDAIGIHAIFGALVFGLTIPKDGPFAGMLIEKIEDFILNDETFAIFVLMALFTTFITTPVVTAIYKPARRQVPYKHRKIERKKSKDELRIMACLHSARNIPGMINLIETSRGIRKPALRLYIMHLVELSERSSSIIMVNKAGKNGLPFGNRNRDQQDQIVVAFDAYEQLSKVKVRPMIDISAIQDMHEDICNIADRKRIAMIILPFHKYQQGDGVLETLSLGFRNVNQKVLKHAPCSVGILVDRGRLGGQSQLAPSNVDHHIAVLFFGGPDDREALVFGRRMAEHPGIKLTVIRFLPGTEFDHAAVNLTPLGSHEDEIHVQVYKFSTEEINKEQEKELDEAALQVINTKASNPGKSHDGIGVNDDAGESIVYEERQNSNTVASVLEIAKSNIYHMFLVGRGRFPSPLVADLAERTAGCPELGPIGDLLTSSNFPISASVLVIQQHDVIHKDEVPFTERGSRLP
eukprot:PITA_12348